MSTPSSHKLAEPTERHLANIADNLQLIADLGYGDVGLAVAHAGNALSVVADARPNTAVSPIPASRVGLNLSHRTEPEAYRALETQTVRDATETRTARGIKYTTSAFPVAGPIQAVIVLHIAEQIIEAPGAMEMAFMEAARELLLLLSRAALTDVRSGEPFSTQRTAGDGVMRVDTEGRVSYASPNAVNILRLAGHEGGVRGVVSAELPGGGYGIAPVLGSTGTAISAETKVGDRSLLYRSIALPEGAIVLVEDVTESRRREAELKVKEATIREVHHRVKNNLQTIASLLRLQARRTVSDEARRALAEATERVSSMAVVHDLLAGSDEERVDLAEAAATIVELVRRGFVGDGSGISVAVEGESGLVDAHMATSLALAVAELVHNALEHGLDGADAGEVRVQMRRLEHELVIIVRDNGRGLPADFDPVASANLGLEIVRTVVEDDLHGTITFSGMRGTTVTVRVPLTQDA